MKESDEDAALLHLYNPFIIKKSFSDRKKSVQVKNDPRHSLSLSGPPWKWLSYGEDEWLKFLQKKPTPFMSYISSRKLLETFSSVQRETFSMDHQL